VGSLLFGLVLVLMALSFFAGCRGVGGEKRCSLLGACCGICGVLVMGLFDYVWYHTGMLFLFFASCACLSVVSGGEVHEGWGGVGKHEKNGT